MSDFPKRGSVEDVRELDVGRESQMAILGSMLIDPDITADCLSRVRAEDFLNPTFRAIFTAFRDVFNAGQNPDPLIVLDRLGREYKDLLSQLVEITPTSANWLEYADILRKQSTHYRLVRLGEKLAATADMEEAQSILDEISAAGCGRPGVRVTSLQDCYQEFLDRHAEGKHPPYITWGISDLDHQIYIEEGDFVVLGGYPSAGKTALALQVAYYISQAKRVGYFYLENNDKKLFDRLVSAQALVPFGKIKRYELEEDDFSAIVSIQDRLVKPALEFVDASGMTVSDLRAVALSHRYDMVIIDYLQKLRGEGKRLSDFERVSQVSDALQNLGRQTGIVIFALSQLGRPEKKRDGTIPAPNIHSFRQSGQIEQDADVALVLYKEDEGEAKSPRRLKVVKNKEGITGAISTMYFDGDTQTFRRIAPAPEPQKRKRQKPLKTPLQETFWKEESPGAKTPFDQ